MLEQITKNIKHGWVTTLLGVLIIIGSIAAVFIPSLSWEWDKCLMGISIGIAFIGAPDPKKTDTTGLMLATVVVVTMFACKRWHNAGTVTKDSTWTEYKKDTLLVKGQTVKTIVNFDSIKKVLIHLQTITDTGRIEKTSADGKQKLIFTLDKQGQVIANCETSDKLIEYLSKEIHRLKEERNTIVAYQSPPWEKNLIWFLIALVAVLLLIVIKK